VPPLGFMGDDPFAFINAPSPIRQMPIVETAIIAVIAAMGKA
jgi:hypothetical protein